MKRFYFLSCLILVACRIIPVIAAPPGNTALKQYVYEDMTVPFLSQLYWKLERMDLDNNAHIDGFIRINHCDIYKDYFQNEFEWEAIRKSTREFLQSSAKEFPIRFEFMQPLKLDDYDIEKSEFVVNEEYIINWARRFEVISWHPKDATCFPGKSLEGYPNGLIIQFSRPFALLTVPVHPQIAQDYISNIQEKFRKLGQGAQTQKSLHDLRDAYIVFKVRAFSSDTSETLLGMDGTVFGNLMAMLEGFEIYADIDKELLLYKKNMVRSRTKPKAVPQKRNTAQTTEK